MSIGWGWTCQSKPYWAHVLGKSENNHLTGWTGQGSTKGEGCPPRTGESVPLKSGRLGKVLDELGSGLVGPRLCVGEKFEI